MGVISWIFVGLVLSWFLDKRVRGNRRANLPHIILGMVGALVGGLLAALLLDIPGALSGFDLRTFIFAFLGAMIVIALLLAFQRQSPV